MFFIVFKNYFYLIHNITMFEFLCPHMQETIVPKRTLGPFLTLSVVRNGHKLNDCVIRIPVHIESIVDYKNYNKLY